MYLMLGHTSHILCKIDNTAADVKLSPGNFLCASGTVVCQPSGAELF